MHYSFHTHNFDQVKVIFKTNYYHSSDEPKVRKMIYSDYINLTQNTGKPPQTTYPFKTTPRWLSCKHLNYRATKAPNINSEIIPCTFIKRGPNNLQYKYVLVWLHMITPLIWNKQVIYSKQNKIIHRCLQEVIAVSNVKTKISIHSTHQHINIPYLGKVKWWFFITIFP